jgi:hypothetical protein
MHCTHAGLRFKVLKWARFVAAPGRIPPTGVTTLLGKQVGKSKAPFVMQDLYYAAPLASQHAWKYVKSLRHPAAVESFDSIPLGEVVPGPHPNVSYLLAIRLTLNS